MRVTLKGLITPTATPFNADLSIDHALYAEHSGRLLEQGCAGLVPFGTTGEATSVSVAERKAAVEGLVKSGIPAERLLPGAGLCNMSETAELIRHATELGCAGVLVLPPFYFKDAGDEGLFAYFAQLIERCSDSTAPTIYLYHIPQVAGVGVSVSLAKRLKEAFPEVVAGIKDSSYDWDNTAALLSDIPALAVFPGSEKRIQRALAAGAPGCITAGGNLNTPAIARLISSAGDDELAKRVDAFHRALTAYPLIPGIKWLLATLNGIDHWRNVRLPMLPLSSAKGEALLASLRSGGLL